MKSLHPHIYYIRRLFLAKLPKTVIVHKFEKGTGTTLNDVIKYMEDYRQQHPDRQIFFDGDMYAVCYTKK